LKTLGTLYDAKRQFDKAIQCYSRALLVYPNDVDVLHLRSMAYTQTKQGALAIADTTKCIQLDAKKSAPYEWRAGAYELVGQYDKAIDDLNKGMTLAPSNQKSRFLIHRADLFHELKKFKEAINDYSTLLKLNSLDETFWLKRGDCRMATGDYESAITDYTETIALSDTSTAYFARSRAYEKLGRLDLASKDRVKGEQLSRSKLVRPI
jgi:tetratricopeptide (TPR) repeat protein